MTIFVDQCRWFYKDHRWCHMVSDVSIEDLHRFAAHLGLSIRGFHADHYDLQQHVREVAVSHGAIEVTSREVVTVLIQSGIRMSPAERRAYAIGQ